MSQKEETHQLLSEELGYLRSLDAVGKSFEYYNNELKSGYLMQIAKRLGYKPEQTLEFTLDLKDDKGELKVKEVDKP